MQDKFEIRSEIALRILRETLIDLRRIAHWTGLTQEQVHVLSQRVGRLSAIPDPHRTQESPIKKPSGTVL